MCLSYGTLVAELKYVSNTSIALSYNYLPHFFGNVSKISCTSILAQCNNRARFRVLSVIPFPTIKSSKALFHLRHLEALLVGSTFGSNVGIPRDRGAIFGLRGPNAELPTGRETGWGCEFTGLTTAIGMLQFKTFFTNWYKTEKSSISSSK